MLHQCFCRNFGRILTQQPRQKLDENRLSVCAMTVKEEKDALADFTSQAVAHNSAKKRSDIGIRLYLFKKMHKQRAGRGRVKFYPAPLRDEDVWRHEQ